MDWIVGINSIRFLPFFLPIRSSSNRVDGNLLLLLLLRLFLFLITPRSANVCRLNGWIQTRNWNIYYYYIIIILYYIVRIFLSWCAPTARHAIPIFLLFCPTVTYDQSRLVSSSQYDMSDCFLWFPFLFGALFFALLIVLLFVAEKFCAEKNKLLPRILINRGRFAKFWFFQALKIA